MSGTAARALRTFSAVMCAGAVLIASIGIYAGVMETVFLGALCAALFFAVVARTPSPPRPKPRPDYSLIARMEREIYGEAFSHDGAPEVAASTRVPRRTGTGTTSTIHFAGRPSLNGGGGGMSTFANMNGRDYCARCHDAWARHQ